MATICEHEFDDPDPQDPTQAMTEFDLAAKLGLTIVKNLDRNRFEIRRLSDKEPEYQGDLQYIVGVANELESNNFIEIRCTHR